ncbi:MAG: hypothetical protein L0I06_01315, partial [Acidipropionibacterium jensenii]|nr:hypothetical protein [Acidipropionibacterium jensenii]
MTEQTSDTEFPPPSAAGPDSPSADPAGAASGGADTGRPAAPAGESRVAQPAILAAMTGHRTEHPPIWFMRQAGRSLPEYRQAREGTTMLESCLDPALAAEITCQPVRRHGVDAAVLYSDIMVPLVLAGVGVRFEPGVG